MTDKKPLMVPTLGSHESGVRRIVADASGSPYRAMRSLAEAQADPEGVVILEGDYGGQIYAVCPARLVRCDEEALRRLLQDIDGLAWRDPDGAGVYFESLPVGSGVWGGMGGGRVVDGVWVHPKLRGFATAIGDVLAGRKEHLR